MKRKLCPMYKEFRFNSGFAGYSEWTPGYKASIYCRKNYWDLNMYKTDILEFRQFMSTAKSSKDFIEEN